MLVDREFVITAGGVYIDPCLHVGWINAGMRVKNKKLEKTITRIK
jgi:hypothetical protein